jgi:nucleoside-diphosphate-sugar epimerase
MTVLITGSEGLIGRHLSPRLANCGFGLRAFDIRRSPQEDIRDGHARAEALDGVEGVVHLAAISRVVWGERDPANCAATNVTALRGLLDIAIRAARRPWVVFVSSREVYGNAAGLPVDEEAPLRPMNVYARTKCDGELLARQARDAGLVVNVARLSSVYGCVDDHADRVVPAFAKAAACGGSIRVDGPSNTLDFTFIDDVTEGLAGLIAATARGEVFPPIHFVSGRGTTLGALAELAVSRARAPVETIEASSRDYDVSHFVGNPARARALLGWSATVPIAVGLKRLIAGFAATRFPPADQGASIPPT